MLQAGCPNVNLAYTKASIDFKHAQKTYLGY